MAVFAFATLWSSVIWARTPGGRRGGTGV